MESYRTFLNSNSPCIVVGDTNVNLAAGSPDKSVIEKEHITRGCQKNRSDIEAFLKDSPFDLTLWENGLKENTLFKNDKWYRCDLMLVSKGTSPHAYLGEREYRDKDKKEKIWTSDHRPIIFEVSLTN